MLKQFLLMKLLKVAQAFLIKSSQFMAYKNGKNIPLLFFLPPDKKAKSYEKTFFHILTECNEINIKFSSKIVFADFENSIHLAILSIWSSITLKGLRFNLGQIWYNKIQLIGLGSEYKIDSDSDYLLNL